MYAYSLQWNDFLEIVNVQPAILAALSLETIIRYLRV